MMAHMPETPLVSYLRLQRAHDRDMLAALRVAATGVDSELRRLQGRTRPGEALRREQLLRSKEVINRQLSMLFARVGDATEAAAARAAAEGAAVTLRASESLLRSVLSASDYDYLMRSARESAARSLEVLEKRISGSSYVPLSESVYNSKAFATGKIDDIVNTALATGSSAAELAKEVRAFVNPNTPGGVRYAAMRLGRTELNNAFHAAQVAQAMAEPWTESVRWNLSGSHPRPDRCNDYAENSHMKDGDAGLWLPEEVPAKPHPNCLCYTTPEVPTPEQFVERYMAGSYDSYLDQL